MRRQPHVAQKGLDDKYEDDDDDDESHSKKVFRNEHEGHSCCMRIFSWENFFLPTNMTFMEE